MDFPGEHAGTVALLALKKQGGYEAVDSLTVSATIDNLDDLIDFVHTEVDRHQCPLAVRNKIDIALEEFYVNVCHYAYKGKEKPGLCRVDYFFSTDPYAITIQLTDWGVPFDPLTRKDPTRPASVQEAVVGGLGILMAKNCVDDIEYIRDGDKNVLVFTKAW